jgi:hypothetical protein
MANVRFAEISYWSLSRPIGWTLDVLGTEKGSQEVINNKIPSVMSFGNFFKR